MPDAVLTSRAGLPVLILKPHGKRDSKADLSSVSTGRCSLCSKRSKRQLIGPLLQRHQLKG